MKKLSVFICVHLWTIFLCLSINAQDFKTVQDGIEYVELTREIDKKPVKMNLLRLDLTKVRLDVVHAMDSAIGTETTSSMAKRHGALAAINAGFFRLDNSIFAGDSAGILQIDYQLLSENINYRVALFIDNYPIPCSVCFVAEKRTEVYFDRVKTWGKIIIKDRMFDLSGINRERKTDDLVLFTPHFNRTTLTDSNGLEIIVKKNKIVEILDGKGSAEIPQEGYVVSASGTKREEILKEIRIGRKVIISLDSYVDVLSPNSETKSYKSFRKAEDIVGGVPQLIKNGKIEITWEAEKQTKAFVETRHPRTAVAKLKDGKFLMITVDGRSEASAGIGLEDLAKLLLEFGATDAMNLDGGGSTTMFLDGKIVNKPSDKEGERKVSDAILVFPRVKK